MLMEPMTGFEPVTPSLPRKYSTTELHRLKTDKGTLTVQPLPGKNIRAEDRARTGHPQLGRLMLYQMSYFRFFLSIKSKINNHRVNFSLKSES